MEICKIAPVCFWASSLRYILYDGGMVATRIFLAAKISFHKFYFHFIIRRRNINLYDTLAFVRKRLNLNLSTRNTSSFSLSYIVFTEIP
jgi:hypothetical protein